MISHLNFLPSSADSLNVSLFYKFQYIYIYITYIYVHTKMPQLDLFFQLITTFERGGSIP